MQKEPPPFIWAIPDEKNILMCMLISLLFLSVPMPYRAICNFELERMLNKCLVPFFIGDYIIVCLKLRLYEAISCQIIQRGPPDSAYAGGEYHGQLIFPSEYPFRPPGIKVRFVIHYDVPHRSISAEIWHLTYISRCWPHREDFSLAKKFASRCRIFIQEL